MTKLAILCTHPIQYYAPVFRMLAAEKKISLTVFYSWGEASVNKFDPGFEKLIEWDIPLLEGYNYTFLNNTSKAPGSSHFNGIINPDIIRDIEKTDPDILLVYGWAYQSHLKAIRYFSKRIPVWFRGDSTLIDPQPLFKNLIRGLFLRWVYSHVSKVLYPGKASKAYFLKYGVKENKLVFVPHAVDNERFSRDRAEEAAILRQGLNISDTETMLLFTGKFEIKKNPLGLIDAFISISRQDTHLVLVGEGPLRDEIAFRVQNNSNIHIVPFVNQSAIPIFYQACDLFCLPSLGPGETWGLAVNEAMVSGKAVLVSDRAGCAYDLVFDHQNGLICSPNKKDNLKERLEYLLSDKALRSVMGLKSRELIQGYSFQHQVSEILKNIPGN